MKKLILVLVVSSFGISTLSSCKKKGCMDSTATNYNSKAKKDDGSCLYKPFVTIIGASDTTINVGTTYNDPGATATNKDGSTITVTSDNQVDATTAGTYYVTYTAANSNGTSTTTRKVTVENWILTNSCGTSFPLNSTPKISRNPTTISFDGMFAISIPSLGVNIASGGTANGTIKGTTITIPSQSYNVAGIGTITYDGIGTMNATGNEFTILYNYTNSIPLVGGSGNCQVTYTKQ